MDGVYFQLVDFKCLCPLCMTPVDNFCTTGTGRYMVKSAREAESFDAWCSGCAAFLHFEQHTDDIFDMRVIPSGGVGYKFQAEIKNGKLTSWPKLLRKGF